MINIKQIRNLKGKKVLIRIDLNCSIKEGKIIESPRIKAHSESLKFLKNKGARVVVIAHQGSVGKSDCINLEQHSKLLNKYVKIKFVNEIIGEKSWEGINNLKNGEILLLENIRFLKEEIKVSNNNSFVNFMKEIGFDYFVNDAFSVSHRNQTSVVSFAEIFPSVVGLVMEKELINLDKLKTKLNEGLLILGGVKIKDIAELIGKGKVLPGGKLAPLYIMASGKKLGYEDSNLSEYKGIFLRKIKKNLNKAIIPIDLAVEMNLNREDVKLDMFPLNYEVLDLGSESIKIYKEEIKKAKAIFVKGSIGMIEKKGFDYGTREILKAVSDSKAFSVIAGGSSSDALKKFGISERKFNYISLSGGALVHYLAGKKLPGIEALKKNKF
jgi:phosphoglycerate kinase